MNGREEFARYVKSARESVGLSKFAAGKALGYQSDGTINAIEQGRMPLPVEQIHPMAKLYGLDIDEFLGKLGQCEPKLYRKYGQLYRDLVGDYTNRVIAQRSSSAHAGRAAHHRAFKNELFEQLTYHIYYQNLKPMEQMKLELQERSLHNRNQKILVFSHARLRGTAPNHSARSLHHHQLRHAA